MLRRTPLRLSAAALSVVVCGLASSPVMAAGTAEGSAAAIVGSLAGRSVDSGRYTATNDGSGETKDGTQNPAMLSGNQGAINGGVLIQDAATKSDDGELSSVACAGLAGERDAIIALGDVGQECAGGGKTLDLSAGSLELGGLQATGSDITSQLSSTLPALPSGFDLTTLTKQLNSALTAFGNPALDLDLDAIQADCTARPNDVSGSTLLAGAKLTATPPNMDSITLYSFEEDPKPNQKVSVTVADLAKELADSLSKSLAENLKAAAASNSNPLSNVLSGLPANGPSQTEVIDAAVAAGVEQFSALEEQAAPLLTGTVNEQEEDDSSIHVTAFDGKVLPAASSAIGSALAELKIGDVTCSTGTAEVDAPSASPSASGSADPVTVDAVPTAVDSGQAGDQSPVLPIVGGLMLLAGAGVGVRRYWLTRG